MVGTDVESDTLFLSTKINKIRWHPAPFLQEEGNTRGLFAVGSYDEVVNKVSIYSLNFNGNNPPETTKLCSQTIKGGAADIKFVLDESDRASLLLASTFNGELVAYNAIDLEETGKLFPEKQGQGVYPNLATIGAIKLHNGALTSMDISNHKEVVTAGSDGDVNVVDMGENIKVLRKIEGDGMPINCIRYMSSCVAIASNQIKLLDIKSNSQIKIRSEKGTPFQSIAPHPHQGNFLCSGSSDGTVNVWDRRATTLPISSQNIHNDNVWEIQFLPGQHDIVSSVSSSLLSLINFNPSQSLTTDFGAKVRHSLSVSSSLSSSHSLSSYSIPFTYGLNSCDSHEGSGLVIGGGDSGNVILAKLNIQNISGNNIRGGMKKNMYIQ